MKSVFIVLLIAAACHAGIVTGPKSSAGDDDRSDAACPAGEFVYKCSCDVESNCDGGQISADGKKCSVFNRWKKGGVSAVADCRGPIKVVHNGGAWQNNPTIDCGDGFTVQSCRHWSAWMQTYTTAHAVKSENGCAVENCPRCQVFAVCQYNGQ